jgi:branched-chain amino acid transport system permease protein
VLIIITHLTAMIWGSNPVVLSRGGQTTVYRLGTVHTTDAQLLIIGFSVVLAVALWFFFKRMRLGIAIRAMGSDSELAEVVGMPAKRLRNISFIVGSGLVGVSAMLIGLNVGIIDFNMGMEVILMATVAMVIGGLGNVGAAAGGGFVLGMIRTSRSGRSIRGRCLVVRRSDPGAVQAERTVRRSGLRRASEVEYAVYIGTLIAIYATLTISLNLLVGYTGLISIAQAAIYGVGAYTTALLALHFTNDLLVSFLVAAAIGVLFSLVIALPSLRLKNEYFLIATMGFQSIIFSLFMNLEITGGASGLYGIPHPTLFGHTIRTGVEKFLLALALAVLCYVLALRITGAPLGVCCAPCARIRPW